MNISVIGAAGGAGRRIVAQAVQAGHTVRALVRTPEQEDMVSLHGAQPVKGDLTGEWQAVLEGADAVVWAAGAGASGNFQGIDGDALIRVVDTLLSHGPRRLVVVSSMGVDRSEQMPPFLSAVLRVKAQSDAHVQGSALDWTVVRPAGLNDEPGTGLVRAAATVDRGSISRDDVAAVVLACLDDPATVGQTFEVVQGSQAVSDALAGLSR
ncbi:NAD-dependent epimerase/dehydratase family protein [Deinococcus sp. KSM4-11]|uniref:NAD(P)-dependent oxidoreductase n=1 Tax=Deinococcus sp. KSM4-11 TaxID=2568654 RepID=UPI0010A40EFE|nr:NAD(P)H-binding protein [Deinococcus sp. KSM4-11]THF87725.1 NAD-dependent epimerase/dehydratase family protein [Deinococcus sp. KSM4-11]